MSGQDVEISGYGVTRFGRFLEATLGELVREAAVAAIADAGLQAADIGAVVFGNAAEGVLTGQEMIRGQVALANTPLAGRPIFNTENACASGSTATHLALALVESGRYEHVLALGGEKLSHPNKARSFDAIRAGVDQSLSLGDGGTGGGSVMMSFYAREALAYGGRGAAVEDAMTAVAVKNRGFAVANGKAHFRDPITAPDVRESRMVADPLRLLMCAPMTDGAAGVVVSAARAARPSVRPRVRIAGVAAASFAPGASTVGAAVNQLYRSTDSAPADVDVWQLHDACAFAEVAQYEQVGIARKGRGAEAVLEGRTGLGGDAPVNTDGGLLSRGHPLGATGIAQMIELTRQLRGETRSPATDVAHAKVGLAVSGGGWMGADYACCFATLLVGD